jgi:hypothetical protein
MTFNRLIWTRFEQENCNWFWVFFVFFWASPWLKKEFDSLFFLIEVETGIGKKNSWPLTFGHSGPSASHCKPTNAVARESRSCSVVWWLALI